MVSSHPKCQILVLCGHTHGGGELQVAENLRVVTGLADSENIFPFSAPPRNRTSSGSFEDCHAIRHTHRAYRRKCLDQDLNLIWTFGGSYAIPCTIETFSIPTWSRTRSKA